MKFGFTPEAELLNSRLAMLASAGWQEWSELGRVYVQLDTDNQREKNLDAGYDDTIGEHLRTEVVLGKGTYINRGNMIANSTSSSKKNYCLVT